MDLIRWREVGVDGGWWRAAPAGLWEVVRGWSQLQWEVDYGCCHWCRGGRPIIIIIKCTHTYTVQREVVTRESICFWLVC